MALDSWKYRDPMDVLDQQQQHALYKQKACMGCIHRKRHEVFGEIIVVCTIRRIVARRICGLYKGEK